MKRLKKFLRLGCTLNLSDELLLDTTPLAVLTKRAGNQEPKVSRPSIKWFVG